MYSGQALPAKVERLSGTPYYRSSDKMAAMAKLDGAPFLLMAPQDPTRALLVVEHGSTPADVMGRPSELSDFSGVTETSDATELVKFVKDDIGLELKVNEAGKVVVLKVERAATPAVPSTATPAAPGTATPAAPGTATPAVPGTATPGAQP
jgi:hypothetical protein